MVFLTKLLDFSHFKERSLEFNGLDITKDEFINLLKDRFRNTDIEMVKKDVRPFLMDAREIEIWSNDYFLQLADMIKFED